jgi:hypothetical protein
VRVERRLDGEVHERGGLVARPVLQPVHALDRRLVVGAAPHSVQGVRREDGNAAVPDHLLEAL